MLVSKTENRIFINISDLWQKQGIFQDRVRNKLVLFILMSSLYEKSVEDCFFSHPATMLPGTNRKQGFSCDTHGRKEIGSKTVEWVVTEAAKLSHALNHLWQ